MKKFYKEDPHADIWALMHILKHLHVLKYTKSYIDILETHKFIAIHYS